MACPLPGSAAVEFLAADVPINGPVAGWDVDRAKWARHPIARIGSRGDSDKRSGGNGCDDELTHNGLPCWFEEDYMSCSMVHKCLHGSKVSIPINVRFGTLDVTITIVRARSRPSPGEQKGSRSNACPDVWQKDRSEAA
jgi:hypothetical protein